MPFVCGKRLPVHLVLVMGDIHTSNVVAPTRIVETPPNDPDNNHGDQPEPDTSQPSSLHSDHDRRGTTIYSLMVPRLNGHRADDRVHE